MQCLADKMEYKEIKSQFDNLPDPAKREVEDFIEFLSAKYSKKKDSKQKKNKKSPLKFEWAGGLKQLKNKYTSVQLQHKIAKELW